MSIVVEQVLHGYRRGHERLAGSVKLSSSDADLINRLSDLSGTLSTSNAFAAYLTTYPLPSGSFYAVAQTWPDDQATRSGCVITHTLLVTPEAWRTVPRPRSLGSLFLPAIGRSTYELYERRLVWHDEASEAETIMDSISEAHVNFVHRYFAEGKRPIVWFGNPDPAATLWQLLTGLWPALRDRFAACTFCLRPRSLEDRPFDLMFAPNDMHARFLKLSSDHIVDSEAVAAIPSRETWCQHWAERMFGGATDTVANRDLWIGLDDDPTAIKRVYLVEAALKNHGTEPLAAVGAMDLVESVARSPDAAPNAKIDVAKRAVSVAGSSADVAKGLECLRLIEDRLRRNAYSIAALKVGPFLSRAVADYTARNAELVATSSSDDSGIASQGELSWYGQGLLDGFQQLAETSPTQLVSLRNVPAVAERLFRADPAVALAYGSALFSQRSNPELQAALLEWLNSNLFGHVGPALRRALLPHVTSQDVLVLPVLLQGIADFEVHEILNSLEELLSDPGVERALQSTIANKYPHETRSWLYRMGKWRSEFVELASATYSRSRQGLDALLSDKELTGVRRCLVLTSYLNRIADCRFPSWICDAAHEDMRLVLTLLDAGAAGQQDVDRVLSRLLKECDGIRLAHSPEAAQLLPAARTRNCFPQILDVAYYDLIRGYLSGTIADPAAIPLVQSKYGEEWILAHPQGHLRALLTHEVWRSTNWVNAWRILLIMPTAFYHRSDDMVIDVIDCLLRTYNQPWSTEVAKMWSDVLVRAKNMKATPHIQLALAAQGLQFSLGNPRLPLSPVLVQAFRKVYDAVVDSDVLPHETRPLFGLWDWDKGKELRKGLVDAFFGSNWPPGDLAFAVASESLLRKVVRRIQRKNSGDRYLHAMLADLRQRTEPDAQRICQLLMSLLQQPNYYEEWD